MPDIVPTESLTVCLKRYRPFTFCIAVDWKTIEPMLSEVENIHRMFNQLPILPDIASQLDRDVLVTSIHGTDTIEGGTLTEEETERVLENPEAAREQRERRVTNMQRAYMRMQNYVGSNAIGEPLLITEQFVRELHRDVSNDLGNDAYRPGLYRDNPKGITTKVGDADHGGVYKPPQAYIDIKLLMENLIEWLNSPALCNLHPLVRASLAHYYFECIHPFQDGNGRVGRILEKAILLAAGYRRAAYSLDRYYLDHLDDYFTVFNLARQQETENPDTCNTVFVKLVLKGMIETIERLHKKVCRMVEGAIYLGILGNLFRHKEINYRQHAILEQVLGQARSISEKELKTQGWYKALYKTLSPATKSRDWKQLFNQKLLEIAPDGKIRPGPNFSVSTRY